MDCNLHIGVYPPLTVSGAFVFLQLLQPVARVRDCGVVVVELHLGYCVAPFCICML